jgi:hypothetical protein
MRKHDSTLNEERTNIPHRFSRFTYDYPISYSSTLISPYDPFIDTSKKSRALGTDVKKPSAYMILPFSQHLFSIEINRSSAKSAGELAFSYFPPNFHWIPEQFDVYKIDMLYRKSNNKAFV